MEYKPEDGQVICKFADIPEVNKIVQAQITSRDALMERAKSLNKEMKRLLKQKEDSNDKFWQELTPLMKQLKLIPEDYSHDDMSWNIELDEMAGMVRWSRMDPKDLMQAVMSKLGGMLPPGLVPPGMRPD